MADRGSTGVLYHALPNSRQEIDAAAASFGNQRTTLLTGAAATKAAIKESELGRYRVLHFAVHGLADDIHPDRAALVLLSDSKTGEDGLLSATEIAQLQLSADLVILSACDTAVGSIEGQGGIATLSRSFMLAGARSVISTLWAVDDDSSLALLKEFYEHFEKTAAPSESLAFAKRVMLAKFRKAIVPYYWASFSFEGVPKSAIAHYAK